MAIIGLFESVRDNGAKPLPYVADNGGHLLGYTLVRAWIDDSTAHHSDLILSTIRTAFFENSDLATMIENQDLVGEDFRLQFIYRFERIVHTLSAKLSEEQKRRDDEWPGCLYDLSDQPLVKRYVGQKLDSQTVMRVCDVNAESLSQAETGINSRMKGYGVDRSGTVFERGEVESIYRVFSEIVLRVFLGRRYACLGTFQTSMEVRRNLEMLEIKIPSVNVDTMVPLDNVPDSVAQKAGHSRLDVTMGVYIHECDAAPVIHLAAREETIGTLTPRFEGEDLKGWQWADRFDIPIAGEGACDHMLTWLDGLPSIMRYYERIDGYSEFMSEYFQRYGIGWLKCGDHKLKITAKKVEVSSLERIGLLALIDEDSNDLIEGIRNDAAALNERLAYRTSEGQHET